MADKPSSISDEQWASWPDCAVRGCPNKSCLRLSSKYCWPHIPGSDPEEVAEKSLRAERELDMGMDDECDRAQHAQEACDDLERAAEADAK